MKKFNRAVSLLLCAVMLLSWMPMGIWAADDVLTQKVQVTTTTTKTIYALVDKPSKDDKVLIVSNGYALVNDDGDMSAQSVSTTTGSITVNETTYTEWIELDNENAVWTVGDGYTFQNGNYYLYHKSSSGSVSLSLSDDSGNWSYANNYLSYSYTSDRDNKEKNYYFYYSTNNSKWTGNSESNSNRKIYFYKEVTYEAETNTSVIYTLSADDLTWGVDASNSTTLTAGLTYSVTRGDGAELPSGGTYSFTETTDADNVISSISSDGTVTFTGNKGTATVLVKYTWTENGESYTLQKTVNVTAEEPIYALDLCEPYDTDNDGDYDYFESITGRVIIKNVTPDTKDSIWAVITRNGHDIGALGDYTALTWTSSNTNIADVDPKTGVISFTGAEGTFYLTASYEYATGKSVTDTVVYSVSKGDYVVPEDGTNDFPGYPNQGSVRFDKHATAVGNFNDTGIVQIELSMTGVPYTKGNEIDVVLMLDMTGSMYTTSGSTTLDRITPTVTAAKAFVESIVKNEDGTYNNNRIAIYTFHVTSSSSSTGTTTTITDLVSISNDEEYNALMTKLSLTSSDIVSGGTPYDTGLSKCADVLSAAKTDGGSSYSRSQYCVFMTDGCPTDYDGVSSDLDSTSDIKGMFATSTTGTTTNYDYSTRGTAYQYEKYSTQMKADGVTVYTVGLGLNNTNAAWSGVDAEDCYSAACIMLNDISGPAKEATQDQDAGSDLTKMYTGTTYTDIEGKYFFSVDDSNASKMSTVFDSIATSIKQAATNVVVEDKISDDFTLILELPSALVGKDVGLTGQEFYIEVVEYVLDDNKNRTDTVTTLSKVYLGIKDGNYYAASDAAGTEYEDVYGDLTFSTIGEGEKGYWTADSSKSTNGIVVNGYYFTKNGDGTHNITSGAYISGTSADNMLIVTPQFVYDAATRILVWTVAKVTSTELALRYFLYLNNSGGADEDVKIEAGTYQTNDYATLTYDNFQGNAAQQEFPVPQMTWNGAQVSFVFYMVNEKGQPVNKEGKVVPFSEAVYITETYTETVYWNTVDQNKFYEAETKAKDLLPDVYELFDKEAAYTIHVFADEEQFQLDNHFRIDGSNAINTTYVFNTKADKTMYSAPGIYAAYEDGVTEATFKCKSTVTVIKDADGEVTGATYTQVDGETQVAFDADEAALQNAVLTVERDDGSVYAYFQDTDGSYYTIVQKTTSKMTEEGFNFYDTTVAFAVIWVPKLVDDTVVIDFGLDVTIDVTANDQAAGEVTTDNVAGLTVSPISNVDINTGIMDTTRYDEGNYKQTINLTCNGVPVGTATAAGNMVQIRLDKTTGMQLTEPITFYYIYEIVYYKNTDSTEKTTAYMYSSVTVIPASVMYYEQDFVTFSTVAESDPEPGEWTTVGSNTSTAQDVDRPGDDILAGLDANNPYGYDSHYLNCLTYSNGSTMKVTVNANTYATATFTFYGTGFDLIGLTSNLTGTVIADVYGYNGETQNQIPTKSIYVDTYYGYKTVTTKNEDGSSVTELVQDADSDTVLYQVPVMTVRDLDYGRYTVQLTVSYNEEQDHQNDGSYDFYLDAVRIYDPTGAVANNETDTVTVKAYIADGEYKPTFSEVKNELLSTLGAGAMTQASVIINRYENSGNDDMGANFIDGNPNNVSIQDYVQYGPNNELYLANGQSLAILIDTTFLTNLAKQEGLDGVADIQLGIKSADGNNVTVKLSNYIRDESGNYSTVSSSKTMTLTTATDMYYSILEYFDGILVIENTGNGIISLTNFKVTVEPTATTTAETSEDETSDDTSEAKQTFWQKVGDFFGTLYKSIVVAVANFFSALRTWFSDLLNNDSTGETTVPQTTATTAATVPSTT